MDSAIKANNLLAVNDYRPILHRIREQKRKVYDLYRHKGLHLNGDGCDRIKDVLVILSSSRSGSSYLYSLLKQVPGIFGPRGELTPFYKLNGIVKDDRPSERIPPGGYSGENLQDLKRDIIYDLADTDDLDFSIDIDTDIYALDVALRFIMQWPCTTFDIESLIRIIRRTIHDADPIRDTHRFYIDVITAMNELYPHINPHYYDIPSRYIPDRWPKPWGPHSTFTVEDSPLIMARPKRHREDVRNGILVLKTPTDSYRVDTLRAMFPCARFHILHLTRNPAGCINGLYDGWLDRGFFSRNMSFVEGFEGLDIKGYSNAESWSRQWWNYDLPDDWQALRSKHLEEVCAHQWISANEQILTVLRENPGDSLTVRYEDLTRDTRSYQKEIERIVRFIGLSLDREKRLVSEPVQCTARPAKLRWIKRKSIILPVLEERRIQMLMKRLGYTDKSGWI